MNVSCCRIHLLCDNLHVEEGGVVGNVLEVLGIEPPSGLGVAHSDQRQRSVQDRERKTCMLCFRKKKYKNQLMTDTEFKMYNT